MSTPFLRAGVARRVISPLSGTRLFGYPNERLGNEVADDLNATALVLQHNETFAAIISLDWCLIDEAEVALLRSEIQSATGIEPDNVSFCATHTHSGPITVRAWGWGEKDDDYLALARPRIVEAVVEAQQNLAAVEIGIGTTQTDIGVNRREVQLNDDVHLGFNQWGPRDRDLTVVRFQTAHEGSTPSTLATLVHVGAHPTSRGEEPSVSRDWPGVMMDRVETLTGAPVVFINGAFGDVAPRTSIGGVVGDGAIAGEEVGLRAAADAMRAWREIKEFSIPDLEIYSEVFPLPLESLPSREETETAFAACTGNENSFGTEGAEWNYWNAVSKAQDAPIQTSRNWQQTITRVGPLVIVPFAGEIFSEIALRLKHHSPFQFTLCAGTSNGSHGYYVTRDARPRGGYEVWVGKAYDAYLLADDIDDFFVQENLKLLQKMSES